MNENDNQLDFSNNNEIMNNNNSNEFKINQPQKKSSKKKFSQALNYMFYFAFIIIIYFLFFVNFLKTNKWYEENTHYINLNPFSICENYILNFEICINETQKSSVLLKTEGDKYSYDTKVICKEKNDKLQFCFDNVHLFSQRCQMYLNELYLCKKKYGNNDNKKCFKNNLINCWRPYNIINISSVYDDL